MIPLVVLLASVFATSFAQVSNEKPVYQSEADPNLKLDAPFVATQHEVVKVMLDLVEVKDGDIVYDLGCGDGRIVIEAARRADIKGVGVDLDPARIAESKLNAEAAGVEQRVEFLVEDLFKTDFRDADVLAIYLLPEMNLRLRPIILEELAPGTRVVAHNHGMRDWPPDHHETVALAETHDIYFYIVPANVSGKWKFEGGEEIHEIQFIQEFQKIKGRVDGEAKLQNANLRGTALEFDILVADGFAKIAGTVTGDAFTGTMTHDALAEPVEFTGSRSANTKSSIIPWTVLQ